METEYTEKEIQDELVLMAKESLDNKKKKQTELAELKKSKAISVELVRLYKYLPYYLSLNWENVSSEKDSFIRFVYKKDKNILICLSKNYNENEIIEDIYQDKTGTFGFFQSQDMKKDFDKIAKVEKITIDEILSKLKNERHNTKFK